MLPTITVVLSCIACLQVGQAATHQKANTTWCQQAECQGDTQMWKDILLAIEERPCDSREYLLEQKAKSHNAVIGKLVDVLLSSVHCEHGIKELAIPEPVLVFSPPIPATVGRRRMEMVVATLEVVVTREGFVSDAKIVKWVSGSPKYGREIVSHAKGLLFVPATLNGRFVAHSFRLNLRINVGP